VINVKKKTYSGFQINQLGDHVSETDGPVLERRGRNFVRNMKFRKKTGSCELPLPNPTGLELLAKSAECRMIPLKKQVEGAMLKLIELSH
jgi:hypothetical protein